VKGTGGTVVGLGAAAHWQGSNGSGTTVGDDGSVGTDGDHGSTY
jgi:hypothetical protein